MPAARASPGVEADHDHFGIGETHGGNGAGFKAAYLPSRLLGHAFALGHGAVRQHGARQ